MSALSKSATVAILPHDRENLDTGETILCPDGKGWPVGPPFTIAKLTHITGLTVGVMEEKYSIHGAFEPTSITGGAPCAIMWYINPLINDPLNQP